MLLAVVAGVVIGLVLGALGGGGSILAVPVLVHVFHEEAQPAMAGALIVVAVSSVTALLAHARRGRVRWAKGFAFGALGTAGAWFGSRLSALVDGQLLLVWFAALLLVVAALMVRRSLRAKAQPPAASGPDVNASEVDASEPGLADR